MKLKDLTKTLWNRWDHFWFGPMDLYSVSLFRCAVSWILLVAYTVRGFDLKLFYFDEGLLPLAQVKEFLPAFYEPWFYWYPASDQMSVIFHCAFLLVLLLLALGLIGRRLTWIALALHLAFLQRNNTIIYGADLIASFWLFYLSFIDHNRCFSLWNLRKRQVNKNQTPKLSDPVSSMGIRFVQIQLCITYAYTGLEKLKGESWWEGTALWRVIGNTQVTLFDLSFMAHVPLVIALMTFTTLIFEVYFCVMVWLPSIRKVWLSLGAIFHLSVGIMMGLEFFSGLMIAPYLMFLSREEIQRFLNPFALFQRFTRRA